LLVVSLTPSCVRTGSNGGPRVTARNVHVGDAVPAATQSSIGLYFLFVGLGFWPLCRHIDCGALACLMGVILVARVGENAARYRVRSRRSPYVRRGRLLVYVGMSS
jgi:hypothetical protein